MRKGIKNFQHNIISKSKRKRGKTDRIQIINLIINKIVNLLKKKKKKYVHTEKNRILEYSPKKISVKIEDPKSVLKPLTSSLSPSEKS